MRRRTLALLALAQVARARLPSFSIHEDLLMRPQFEIVFADRPVSEHDAQFLLDGGDSHQTYTANFGQSPLGIREATHDESVYAEQQPPVSYELMNIPPHRYLCSIPILQPPEPENQTASDIAKAAEAKELTRATENGWGLLAELEDACLYFMSGWWSYSFCNNREIVQFHALPTIPNGQPPRRDPHTAEFTLGRTPSIPPSAEYQARQDGGKVLPAELQVKGDQRYLVQRLEGGTVCDLTGRERTVEVQYHCVPGLKGDRIRYIKEVTICAYLMVVNTPRLCDDVAFLPPQETKANAISCRLISDDDALPLLEEKQQELPVHNSGTSEEQLTDGSDVKDQDTQAEVTIGGVVVGARNVLSAADEAGKPPMKLSLPRSYFGESKSAERVLGVLARGTGTKDMTKMSRAELTALDVDANVVDEMAGELAAMAGEHAWTLELVELAGKVRELRGYIDDENDGPEKEDGGKKEEEGKEGSEEKFFGDA